MYPLPRGANFRRAKTLWELADMVRVLEDWENNQAQKSN